MKTLLAWSLLLIAGCVYAQSGFPQRLEVQDGVTALARISAKEPTRIRVDGALIQDVLGNLFHREKSPAGEVLVEEDKQRGEIFVRPVHLGTKPINLFVMTQRATYTLLLQPVDMPADTIVLVDRTVRPASDLPKTPRMMKPGSDVRPLIESMATDRPSHELSVREVGTDIQLRPGTRFTLMRIYESSRLRGEKYRLVNITAQPLILAEQEFYIDGVVAVAFDAADVPPGGSTSVYVVRKLDQ